MKLHRSSRRPIARIVSAVLASAGALASSAVPAQTSGALEEILVTATRRGETNLQETPVAVTALDYEALDLIVGRNIEGISILGAELLRDANHGFQCSVIRNSRASARPTSSCISIRPSQ